MGKIPSANQMDSFPSGPPVQMRGVTIFAGSAGKPGMDMQIGDHQHRLYLLSIDWVYYSTFFLETQCKEAFLLRIWRENQKTGHCFCLSRSCDATEIWKIALYFLDVFFNLIKRPFFQSGNLCLRNTNFTSDFHLGFALEETHGHNSFFTVTQIINSFF